MEPMKSSRSAVPYVEVGYVTLVVAAIVASAVSGFDPLGLPGRSPGQLLIGVTWYLATGILMLVISPGSAIGRRRADVIAACAAFAAAVFGVARLLR